MVVVSFENWPELAVVTGCRRAGAARHPPSGRAHPLYWLTTSTTQTTPKRSLSMP